MGFSTGGRGLVAMATGKLDRRSPWFTVQGSWRGGTFVKETSLEDFDRRFPGISVRSSSSVVSTQEKHVKTFLC